MKSAKVFSLFCAVVLAGFSSSAQSFLTDGLVAYYPFNGNPDDASGNGYDARVVGGATLTTDRFGNTNQAYYFNGTNSWLQTTNCWPVLGTNALTVSCWIYYEGALPQEPSQSTMCSWGSVPNQNESGQRFEFRLDDNNGMTSPCVDLGWYYFDANASIASKTWTQLVVTKPTNGGANNLTFYVNGVLVPAGNNFLGPNIFNITPTDTLTIGKGQLSETNEVRIFNGKLDQLRIYNRVLSSNEVAELYDSESVPIMISNNPANTSVLAGQGASLSVSASSPFQLSYQWYSSAPNELSPAGAYAQAISGFVYGVVVTNGGAGYGVAPSVSFVGGGGSGAAGFATVSNGFVTGVTVTNAGANYASAPEVVFGQGNGFISAATNNTLTLTNVNAGDMGNYYVVVSSAQGSISSGIANLDVLFPPSITNQPQDAEVEAYGSALFSLSASGTTPISFQWTFNGTNIPNATSDTLSVTNITPANLGAYAVIVTNDYGSVTSSNANLYMYPYLETPFSGAITYWGQTNILSVGAWGSGNLGYQWYLNGNAIDGATGSTLALPAIQFTNAGLYSVVVSSSLGSVTNTPEQVVVNPANTALQLCANVVIQGTVGYTYIIESTMNLGDTNSWVVETNLTLTQPMEFWDDTSVDVHSNAQKYYRVLPAQ